MNNVEGLVILLTYLAVSASAVSGALEARKHEMDIVCRYNHWRVRHCIRRSLP